MNDRDVAVVGMACVFPEAADLAGYWRNLINGVDAIKRVPADRWPGSRNLELPPDHEAHIACSRGGFIPTPFLFDATRFKVMPNVARSGDIDQFVILQIIDDALRDAGIGEDHPCRARTDVIVGRGGYTSNKAVEIFMRAELLERLQVYLPRKLPGLAPSDLDAMLEEIKTALPEYEVDSMAASIPNLVASRAANRLNLRGSAYNVDAACASSLIAVEQALRRLREGLCDVGIACGVNFTHTPSFWYLFSQLTAVSPSGRIAPFDRRADGLLLGEGAGAVVLKRLADARRDGDPIHAVVKGAGSASDGRDTGILAPSSAGQVQALAAAYRDAGVDPDSIGLLEGHGTATSLGDATEIGSIKTFFGERKGRYATRMLGSVKSMIGHTMPAAGIASLIKAALALSNKIVPPSLHCEEPHKELADAPFYVNLLTRPWLHAPHHGPRRAGVNAFGFGGINAHVVLEEVERSSIVATKSTRVPPAGNGRGEVRALVARPIVSGLDRPSELLIFSARGPAELRKRIDRLLGFVKKDRRSPALEDLARVLVEEIDHEAPLKLAVIVEDLESGLERLRTIERQLESGAPTLREHEGVFFSAEAQRPAGRIAALFPGLAFPGLVGQYPDHLMSFCMHFPRMREVFDLVEARDEHAGDALPSSFLLQPPAHLPEQERIRLRQRFSLQPLDALDPEGPLDPELRQLSGMGMLCSNWACWRLLETFEVPIEMLCGQSLGDVSAVCAAGMMEFADTIPRLWKFMSLDPRMHGMGCLAFIGTSEERLLPFLEKFDDVHLALHQSKETMIVGGSEESIAALVRLVRSDNIIATKLPFSPMHTPLVRDKQSDIMRLAAADVLPPIRPSRIPVYSAITGEPIPDGQEAVQSILSSNLTKPVRFWQTLTRMYDDGARIFIQAGSGTLAGNIRSVLPPGIVTAALDVDYRDPITQLQYVCAALYTAGVPLNLHPLFEGRRTEELSLDEPRAERLPQGIPLLTYLSPLPVVEAEPAVPARAERVVRREATSTERRTMPFIGRTVEFEPGRRFVHVRRFALAEDLYLADHAFINCQDVKPLAECFPVVPLTMTLEMMAETGACLAPGLAPIRFENVRARRWIALDMVEAIDVRVVAEAEPSATGGVKVEVEVFVDDVSAARADLFYAARYELTYQPRFSELTHPHAFPFEVRRLYEENYFFHGRRFQCVEKVGERGDRGVSGELSVPTYDDFFASIPDPQMLLDPVVIDGGGQMLGTIFVDKSVNILPVAVEKIELYRPAPPPGTRVPVRVEVSEVNLEEHRILADMEIQDGAGRVWMRIAHWQDISYGYSERLHAFQRQPGVTIIGSERELPGVPRGGIAVVVSRDLMQETPPERLAQSCLNRTEMEAFRAVGPSYRSQRDWLMQRIAIKDAARLWLSRRTGRPMVHPVLLDVEQDATGQTSVRPPEGYDVAPRIRVTQDGVSVSAVALP